MHSENPMAATPVVILAMLAILFSVNENNAGSRAPFRELRNGNGATQPAAPPPPHPPRAFGPFIFVTN
jgi:hypothetical protein